MFSSSPLMRSSNWELNPRIYVHRWSRIWLEEAFLGFNCLIIMHWNESWCFCLFYLARSYFIYPEFLCVSYLTCTNPEEEGNARSAITWSFRCVPRAAVFPFSCLLGGKRCRERGAEAQVLPRWRMWQRSLHKVEAPQGITYLVRLKKS